MSHTVVPIEEKSNSAAIITTIMQQPNKSESQFLKIKRAHRSMPSMRFTKQMSSETYVQFSGDSVPKKLTNRQRAEIQLQGILDDPELSMPSSTRRLSDVFSDEKLSIQDASKLLNTQPFIIERLVNIIYPSQDGSDRTALTQYEIEKLTRVLTATMDVRALLFFMILDENDNNYITDKGLSQFYEKYLSNLKTFEHNKLEIIQVLLQRFQLDQKPRIDYEEFFSIVSKDSTLLESLSQFSVHPTWFMKRSMSASGERNRLHNFFLNLCCRRNIREQWEIKFTTDYIKDNLTRIIFLILYTLINLALLLYVVIYRSTVTKSHVLVVFARVPGMLLNFNCSFIIVLMLKRTILLIRTNPILRRVIPVDDHITFHKFVGNFIGVLATIHTIAHMANFARSTGYSWGTFMFTTIPNIGWVGGFAPLSGDILCIILAVMIICSMEWIRRGGHFQIFYWTHLLYIVFFVFLIVHAKNFWKWIVGPLSLLLLEKLYSVIKSYSSYSGRTFIRSVTIEQSNVISLNIDRPKLFSFKPGDYIIINLPSVAAYEFHPFTISSAPEDTDYVTVHIQAVGNWTKQVYQYFKDMSEVNAQEKRIKIYRADLNPAQELARLRANTNIEQDNPEYVESNLGNTEDEINESTLKTKPIKRELIFVDGPYSSCARYAFDCKHIVLIGAGIGITPYASILSSLMAQFRASRIVCKYCKGINYHTKGLVENRLLKKVDFIWVNRDQKNFEWFLNLLQQFEQEQEHYLASNSNEKRFLDTHLYFTEIKHDENIGNAPLDLVTKVWAQVAGQDIFTSLKSKTHIGRPKWDELFNQFVEDENASTANDVNVFFCGPSIMGKMIRESCQNYRFRYYEEKF